MNIPTSRCRPARPPQEHLDDLTWEGAQAPLPEAHIRTAFPRGDETHHDELALIEKLDYARYFLTVHDIVAYARASGILCQGRGSAANSAVCYCLGITEVDPNKTQLLFARFISQARDEPPDIDVDFEHERREEVIQYIYERYGRASRRHLRHRHPLPLAPRHPRGRQGPGPHARRHRRARRRPSGAAMATSLPDEHIRQAGLDPRNPAIRQAVELASEI